MKTSNEYFDDNQNEKKKHELNENLEEITERQVLDEYIITKPTLAIEPIKHIEYDSVVYELDKTYYVRQTPLNIIKQSCKKYHSTYQGRREAAISQINQKYKTPIVLSEIHHLVAFPTTSPKRFECAWILFHPIKSIKDANPGSYLEFINDLTLTLPISHYCLQNRINATQRLYYSLTQDTFGKSAMSDLNLKLSQGDAQMIAWLRQILGNP